jgi:N-methylhydantoinase B
MDAVKTAIMNNRFSAIVEEASVTLHRTAHTTFVKLVQDYQCAIATPNGDIFAYPSQSGVNSFIGLPLRSALRIIRQQRIEPGDCFITNDPFSTDGLVTHLMDVTMIRPIFRGERLVAFAWGFVHASDIGGAVPGSINPAFTEVFQEGIRIRPMKLYAAGKLNENIRDLLLDNSRIPEDLWGDLKAMISALQSMDRRLNQLCDRYGTEDVCEGMDQVLAFAEAKARAVISTIPDGTYTFADYLEGMEEDEHIYIRCSMTVAGDEITFDFTGTDPQVLAAYNYVTGDDPHPYTLQAMLYYILTREPDAPKTSGLLRPIRNIALRGTVINAEFPAAGGSRVAASTRVFDAIIGCLHKALPTGLAAAGPGMSAIIVYNARDPRTGRNRVSVVNPVCGGSGGRYFCDGVDAIDSRSGYLRSVPVEVIEAETALRVRGYHLAEDSAGAGTWCGGSAVVLEMENTDIDATMTVRGMNRFVFQPWGARGGEPGRLGEVVLNPGRADERQIGKISVLKLRRGDVVRITTPAGGGFGAPFDRDAEFVARDVRSGLLSQARARAYFGVACDAAGKIDEPATRKLRDAPKREVKEVAFGHYREGIDAVWPDAIRARLATEVLRQDRRLRPHIMRAVRASLTQKAMKVDQATLDAAIEATRATLEEGSGKSTSP